MKIRFIHAYLVLSVLLAAGSVSHAQDKSSDFLGSSIDELQTSTDRVVKQLKVNTEVKSVDFPDFEEVYSQFTDASEIQSIAFKKVLIEMKNEAEQVLSKSKSELETVRKIAKEQPNRINSALLKIQTDRFKTTQRVLNRKLNEKYHAALVNLVGLGGTLIFPVRHGLKTSVILVIAGGLVLLPSTFFIAGLTAAPLLASLTGFYGIWATSASLGFTNDEPFNKVIQSEDNLGEQNSQDPRTHAAELKNAAERIFRECFTGGCALKMSEVYASWFKQTRTLNRSIDLGYGIRLRALPMVSDKKVESAIVKLGILAADQKSELSVLATP